MEKITKYKIKCMSDTCNFQYETNELRECQKECQVCGNFNVSRTEIKQ